MPWIEILKLLLSFAASIAKHAESKQLLDAGKALAIVESLNNAKDIIKKANEAKSKALANFDFNDELYGESDPNRRD